MAKKTESEIVLKHLRKLLVIKRKALRQIKLDIDSVQELITSEIENNK